MTGHWVVEANVSKKRAVTSVGVSPKSNDCYVAYLLEKRKEESNSVISTFGTCRHVCTNTGTYVSCTSASSTTRQCGVIEHKTVL